MTEVDPGALLFITVLILQICKNVSNTLLSRTSQLFAKIGLLKFTELESNLGQKGQLPVIWSSKLYQVAQGPYQSNVAYL